MKFQGNKYNGEDQVLQGLISPRDGRTWLTIEVKDYAANRLRIIEILEFLAALRENGSTPHWHEDAEAAVLLAGTLCNRQDNV